MKAGIPALAATLLALAAFPAAGERLDDSLSPQQRIEVTPEWRYEGDAKASAEEFNALVARIRGFEFRFNTTAYVGKTVQIYLVLPLQISGLKSPNAMRVDWQTRGLFASGSAIPGSRNLVFTGTVTQPVTREYFDFQIHIDGRQMDRGLRFDPQFEIEVIK